MKNETPSRFDWKLLAVIGLLMLGFYAVHVSAGSPVPASLGSTYPSTSETPATPTGNTGNLKDNKAGNTNDGTNNGAITSIVGHGNKVINKVETHTHYHTHEAPAPETVTVKTVTVKTVKKNECVKNEVAHLRRKADLLEKHFTSK